MYRVLIADDELPILQGLQAIIDWRALGFEVCAAVQDGQTALEQIEALRPDLVLMDLRMPRMDGMDAIEAARRHGYQGHFIVLSGAADFAYAQRAVRSRASYYLTKPIDEDELAEAVRQIAAELETTSRRQELAQQAEEHSRSSLLFRLLNGIADPAQDDLAKAGLAADAYQVAAAESFDPRKATPKGALPALLRQLGLDIADSDSLLLENREYVLLRGQAEMRCLAEGLAQLRTRPGPPAGWDAALVALGRAAAAPEEIVLSYCDVVKLMQRRFFSAPERHVLTTGDLPAEGSGSAFSGAPYTRLFVDLIQAGNFSRMDAGLREFARGLAAQDISVAAAKMLLTELYVTVRQQIAHLYPGSMAILASETASVRQIEETAQLAQAAEFLRRQFQHFSDAIQSGTSTGVADRVRRYIDHNCQNSLKMEELAALFGYNSSYLGKLFRDRMGCSFNEYLDKARIERAKELLTGPAKVYEIAEQLGYKDVDYFHKKFKKYVGVSPNEYRRSLTAQKPQW